MRCNGTEYEMRRDGMRDDEKRRDDANLITTAQDSPASA